jgi:hypothetical protein
LTPKTSVRLGYEGEPAGRGRFATQSLTIFRMGMRHSGIRRERLAGMAGALAPVEALALSLSTQIEVAGLCRQAAVQAARDFWCE